MRLYGLRISTVSVVVGFMSWDRNAPALLTVQARHERAPLCQYIYNLFSIPNHLPPPHILGHVNYVVSLVVPSSKSSNTFAVCGQGSMGTWKFPINLPWHLCRPLIVPLFGCPIHLLSWLFLRYYTDNRLLCLLIRILVRTTDYVTEVRHLLLYYYCRISNPTFSNSKNKRLHLHEVRDFLVAPPLVTLSEESPPTFLSFIDTTKIGVGQ